LSTRASLPASESNSALSSLDPNRLNDLSSESSNAAIGASAVVVWGVYVVVRAEDTVEYKEGDIVAWLSVVAKELEPTEGRSRLVVVGLGV
jgi:hypothetical protein